MVQIKPAKAEEATLIAQISRKTFIETFAAQNTRENMELFLSSQFTVEQLEAETKLPGVFFFIAWSGTEPYGYLKLQQHINGYPGVTSVKPVLEISRIYVIKEAIGKGIGQQLLDYSISLAREIEYPVICLGVWEKNDRAIKFYQKNGFVQVGTHSFLLGEDNQTDWLMARNT